MPRMREMDSQSSDFLYGCWEGDVEGGEGGLFEPAESAPPPH